MSNLIMAITLYITSHTDCNHLSEYELYTRVPSKANKTQALALFHNIMGLAGLSLWLRMDLGVALPKLTKGMISSYSVNKLAVFIEFIAVYPVLSPV